MRCIGVDLHKTSFVACFLDDGDVPKLETHTLTESGLTAFCRSLRPSDHLAVETAQNVYYFYERIRSCVDRVVLVDPYKFAVIAKSKKKTDRHDAITIARFLKLGWLPSVPIPSEKIRQLRILCQARENLVQMTTQLKNMGHAALTRNGVALRRAAFTSASTRQHLAHLPDLASIDQQILGAVLRQLDSLEGEIAKLDAEILRRGRDLPGLPRLLQIRGFSTLTEIGVPRLPQGLDGFSVATALRKQPGERGKRAVGFDLQKPLAGAAGDTPPLAARHAQEQSTHLNSVVASAFDQTGCKDARRQLYQRLRDVAQLQQRRLRRRRLAARALEDSDQLTHLVSDRRRPSFDQFFVSITGSQALRRPTTNRRRIRDFFDTRQLYRQGSRSVPDVCEGSLSIARSQLLVFDDHRSFLHKRNAIIASAFVHSIDLLKRVT